MRLILFITTLLTTSSLCFAEQNLLYVQSSKAKLMAQPKFSAEVIGTLQQGAVLEQVQHEKRWVQVIEGTHTGWVSSFLLSKQPPLKKISVLENREAQNLEESARRRASAVTTAGAARGLSADDRKRANAHNKADFLALERVEDFQVTTAEVKSFAQEGQLQ